MNGSGQTIPNIDMRLAGIFNRIRFISSETALLSSVTGNLIN